MLEEILSLEMQGWQALSSDLNSAKEFYDSLLDDNAIMLLPGGIVLEGKSRILKSFAAQPWHSFKIQEPRVVPIGKEASVLAYKVRAYRKGSNAYSALISSTYRRQGETWTLGFHQHTPF